MTGSIKTKTPKFKFIIPQFNIATWHDYIEDNFRAIDALFYNIFDIQNYKGSWTKTTEYKKDQVLFIPEDYEVDENGQFKTDEYGNLITSLYSGRMVKVLIDHTTDNSDYFSLYYYNHKNLYELFADASNSQVFANLAKKYSENAKQSENNAELYKNNAQSYAQESKNNKNIAQQNAQLATNQANLSKQYADNAKTSENNAAISKNNAKVSENITTNLASLAQQYKDSAKDWAVSQNIVDNIDYSSKYWARKSKEWAESVSSPVNKNLSNLNPQGQNIANWSTNVTNCIAEIPQDIKLELNNGTLTLKADSKVYVPNGFESDGTTKKFDIKNIKSDVTASPTENGTFLYGVHHNGTLARYSNSFSGDTQPTSQNLCAWYDTTNNKIKRYLNNPSIWEEGFSFPIAIVTISNNKAVSIDQVFNGFGYIGKRNFITNVKFLIAKGYNTDGTYHNQEYIINSPIVALNDFGDNSIMFFRNNNSGYQIYNITKRNYLGELDYIPNVGKVFQWYYNIINRMWYMHEQDEQTWRQVDYANIGINTSTETNFKEVFKALDYNDKSTISGWNMPSSRYINLTLGANGSTYTAPANGYFYLGKSHSSAGGIIDMQNITSKVRLQTSNVVANDYMLLYLPVRKDDTIKINYKANGTLQGFMFIYAEGEN